jgi:hypothetical protein
MGQIQLMSYFSMSSELRMAFTFCEEDKREKKNKKLEYGTETVYPQDLK